MMDGGQEDKSKEGIPSLAPIAAASSNDQEPGSVAAAERLTIDSQAKKRRLWYEGAT